MGVVFGGQLFLGTGAILDLAVLALVPVSTALIWWSYLPLAGESYSETFE